MNVFDIIGPVMIGPSSSHTAGAARIGFVARALLGRPPVRAEILLHGSFAGTYRGHGTDKALVAGILGMRPDDERLRDSLHIAAREGLRVQFTTGELEGAHPNTARITLHSADGETLEVTGASVGGGSIRITSLNGMAVNISGENDTLVVLHEDRPGVIAQVTATLRKQDINICSFSLSRLEKGGRAVMTIEVDGHCEKDIPEQIGALPDVLRCVALLLGGN